MGTTSFRTWETGRWYPSPRACTHSPDVGCWAHWHQSAIFVTLCSTLVFSLSALHFPGSFTPLLPFSSLLTKSYLHCYTHTPPSHWKVNVNLGAFWAAEHWPRENTFPVTLMAHPLVGPSSLCPSPLRNLKVKILKDSTARLRLHTSMLYQQSSPVSITGVPNLFTQGACNY